MDKPILNIAEIISLILKIESQVGVKCLSYGLYDKQNKEYITRENMDKSYDYYNAYDNRCKYRYTYSESLTDNPTIYLLQHHGEIYFPMLMKGTQKAYVAQFDITELLSKHGERCSVTPDSYFKEKFCWSTPKKKASKQCEGQLTLQF